MFLPHDEYLLSEHTVDSLTVEESDFIYLSTALEHKYLYKLFPLNATLLLLQYISVEICSFYCTTFI